MFSGKSKRPRLKSFPFKEKRKCKICNQYVDHIANGDRKGNGWIWRDQGGKKWSSKICPSCAVINSKQWDSYKKGLKYGSVDDVQYHPIKRGREAERLVACLFRLRGWQTKLTTLKGTDLTIYKNDLIKTVEVKRVCGRPGHWFVSPVSQNCQNNDLIALVLPCDHVAISDMAGHLKKCSKKGYRGVTRVVNECFYCGLRKLKLTNNTVYKPDGIRVGFF